ncbi:MAG: NAD(P)-dependent oxidoreductase [Candidatus Krumholzibacteriota bacterium]|nr:NAD(P)-dependent oxidoreductase [Candidatus Krumholzibacteriota bacterium]
MDHDQQDLIIALEDPIDINAAAMMLHGTHRRDRQRVLILGGAGYLGNILTRNLLEAGHEVTVLDQFLYGSGSLDNLISYARLKIQAGDVRDREILRKVMKDCDQVVNLAAIVGDEACRINPRATWEINVESVRSLVRLSRELGGKRIIQASTCSTYGKNDGEALDEDTPLAPLSLYAESKVESERLLLEETYGGMEPSCCILRFSTLFGFSRRPRFDLVVNTLTAHAWKRGKLTIFGGEQWRPLLHVGDAARAVRKVVEAPAERVRGKIYNTGGEYLNLTIKQLGNIVRELIPETEVEVLRGAVDERDYRIDFSRIRDELGYQPEHSISNGIYELIHALDTDRTIDPDDSRYSNYKWLSKNAELLQRRLEMVP